MIITVNRDKLLGIVKILEKMVSRVVTLPILGTLLLKTDEGRLRLSATNLEIGANFWVRAKIEKEGEIAIPAHIFFDFLSNITDDKITLITNKNIISINSENYKTQILCMDSKDFPIIPKIKKESIIKVKNLEFKNSLASVLDSVSLSETRPELSGVFINVLNDRVEFAATDGARLSEKIIHLRSNGVSKSFIVPRNSVIEIMRILESIEGEVDLAISENQLLLYNDDFEFISRLIDGRYPEYKKIIPEKFISSAVINRNDLEKKVRTASIFSSNISDIRIKADKDSIEILAKNSDRGEIALNIPCRLKGKPFEFLVNYHYILDGLKIIPSEDAVIEFTGNGSPIVLRGEEKNNLIYIVMPLRG
jgi:DNA polymerase-3 subunit beta